MSNTVEQKTLVFIFGPPAAGKRTVGYELAARAGLKLFHNDQTIDLVLPFFSFGSPRHQRLVGELRRRIFEEVAESDLPGLILPYVWAFDQPSDEAEVDSLAEIFISRGHRVVYVELEATQAERLYRTETELRLSKKPAKRDLTLSSRLLLEDDAQHQLDSTGKFDGREDYLRFDTTALKPGIAAKRIMDHFSL